MNRPPLRFRRMARTRVRRAFMSMNPSPWNSLEIAKLLAGLLTPAALAAFGIYIHRVTKRFNVSKQTTLTPFRMNTYEKSAGWGEGAFPSFLESFMRHWPRDSTLFALYSCALFCIHQKPTLLFSSNSALFRKNTRGWGAPLLSGTDRAHP